MARLKQFRSREASLWQSAVDEVVAARKKKGGAAGLGGPSRPAMRPPQDDPAIVHANQIAALIEAQAPLPSPPPPGPAAGVADVALFCSTTAAKLAGARVKAFFTGDQSEVRKLEAELKTRFSNCDPQWPKVVAVYVAHRIASGGIPYVRHSRLDDFVITGRLPDQAKVALVGDWGTGQDGAAKLLGKIASRKPDVVIHLGDVYYSGTEHEFRNYFYAIWQSKLGLPKVDWGKKLTDLQTGPATYTICGNHDLYAGGKPYYTVLGMIGQPASYFCLRNSKWQFIALDTGLHDSSPVSGSTTFLEDGEVEWLKHKIATAGGRQTVLMSHHQLYSAFEKIGNSSVNSRLLDQVRDSLPAVSAWFWGHEHKLVVYGKHHGVLGRCVGHGAFPVGVDEMETADPSVPVEAVTLSPDQTGGLFQHGYAILDLDGASAEAAYWQFDPATGVETELHRETL